VAHDTTSGQPFVRAVYNGEEAVCLDDGSHAAQSRNRSVWQPLADVRARLSSLAIDEGTLSVYLFICLSVYQFISLSTTPVYPSIRPPWGLFLH
jgi:hypothetical protein